MIMSSETDGMADKKNQISLVDFAILQFFYAFQSVYDRIVSILNWSYWKQQPALEAPPQSPTNEKRHFIQLYKTEPLEEGEQPICFINVIEFDSSCPEEEIRRRKRSYDFSTNESILKYQRHKRSRSDNELQRFYCSNLRY
ncbi:hypothetical protein HUJ04_010430 [Dendroctonus ponderosae]|nr:hypothetical protein HUJ04_010430 [Dendroctonus ponderosae]KAH1027841.1 hypothetical protein HUJ05_001273 [Dendroctonus ponderosae]